MMSNLIVCRICLADNIRLNEISNTPQQEIFEKFTGAKLITEDGKPDTLCYLCSSQLRRFSRFSDMSRQAEAYLTALLGNRSPEAITLKKSLHNLTQSTLQTMSLIDPVLLRDKDIVKMEPPDTSDEEMLEDTGHLIIDTDITDNDLMNMDMIDNKDIVHKKIAEKELINGEIADSEKSFDTKEFITITIIDETSGIITNGVNADDIKTTNGLIADSRELINEEIGNNVSVDNKEFTIAIIDETRGITNGVNPHNRELINEEIGNNESVDNKEFTIAIIDETSGITNGVNPENRELINEEIGNNGSVDNKEFTIAIIDETSGITNGVNPENRELINEEIGNNESVDNKEFTIAIIDETSGINNGVNADDIKTTKGLIADNREITNEVIADNIKTTNGLIADSTEITNEVITISEDIANNKAIIDTVTILDSEDEFSCDQCEKKFNFIHQLNFHKRLHKSKGFHCNICDKRFTTNNSLSVHLAKIHNKININDRKISVKNKKTKSAAKVTKNSNNVNSTDIGNAYKCTRCAINFVNETDLVKHAILCHTTPQVLLEKVVIDLTENNIDLKSAVLPNTRSSPRLAKCRKI